jgi:hypothetical protein
VTNKLASSPLALLVQAAETSFPLPRVNNSQRFDNVIIQLNDMLPPVAVNTHIFGRKRSTILRGVVAARRAKLRAVQKIVAAVKSIRTKQQ